MTLVAKIESPTYFFYEQLYHMDTIPVLDEDMLERNVIDTVILSNWMETTDQSMQM